MIRNYRHIRCVDATCTPLECKPAVGQKPQRDPSNGGAALGSTDVWTPKERVLRPTSHLALTSSYDQTAQHSRRQRRAGLPEGQRSVQGPGPTTPAHALPPRSLRTVRAGGDRGPRDPAAAR